MPPSPIRYGMASEVYMLLDKLPEAEEFARKAYNIDIKGGREGKAAIRQSQLASVLIKAGKLAEAKAILTQAMETLRNESNTYSYTICLNQLGDVCMAQNNQTEAAAYYTLALETAEADGFRYMKQRALKGLWNALRNKSVARAAAYLEQYTLLSDSLHNEATENQLANMQAQFEYQQLQSANQRLIYQAHINTLIWIAGIIACFLVITILCYILYAKNRKRIIERQGNVVLELIEEKAKAKNVDKIENVENIENAQNIKHAENDPNVENNENVENDDNLDYNAPTASPDHPSLPQKDTDFLNKFVTFVTKNLSEGTPVDATTCASHLCVSPRHFSRRVMAITGFTPTAYINRIKINHAKRLLDTRKDLTITEISLKSGFEDPAYFSKIFRQIEGVTPSQYRHSGGICVNSR